MSLVSELAESPAVVERLVRDARAPLRELAGRVEQRGIDAVFLAARGTSDHAATYAQYVLGIRNGLAGPMGNIDWHFCVVGLESPEFADSERRHTYLFDGQQLRTFAQLSGGPKMELFKVRGGRFRTSRLRAAPVTICWTA